MEFDIKVKDNFLEEDLHYEILEKCRTSSYCYGETDNQDNSEYLNPPTGMTSFLDVGDYCYDIIKEEINKSFSDLNLISDNPIAYINCYAPKEQSYFHTDTEDGSVGYTLIYYPNLKWDLHDGGETQFYVDQKIIGIPPIPNRIIKFKVPILHRATPFIDRHRFSIAFKYQT